MKSKIFIPYNVPSSKNSKQLTGKILIHSKTTRNYIKRTKQYYIQGKKEFDKQLTQLLGGTNIEHHYPLHIDFYFIRDTKRKFDYINPAQTVQDLMVKYGWIEDDNCHIIVPHFSGHHVDKENSGVLINLLNMEEESKYIRSKEHRKFLIEQYNRNRPADKHVHSMEELNRALLTEEINAIPKFVQERKGKEHEE